MYRCEYVQHLTGEIQVYVNWYGIGFKDTQRNRRKLHQFIRFSRGLV